MRRQVRGTLARCLWLLLGALVVFGYARQERPDSVQRRLEGWWDSGFPAARALSFDSAGRTVWRLERGDAWVWAPAVQLGEGKTRPEVFAALAGLQAGEPVRLSDAPAAARLLARQGYYEIDGEASFYRIKGRNRLVPAFRARDLTLNRLEAALAYSTDAGGWNGDLRLELRNISGTARDLDFYALTGEARRSGSLYYKEPDLLGMRYDLRLEGEVEEGDSSRERGWSAELARRVGFEWEYLAGGGMGSRDWSSFLGLAYDGRDRLPLPREGGYASLRAKVLSPRGDDTASRRVLTYGKGGWLVPFGAYWSLLLSGQGATLLPAQDYSNEYLLSLGGKDDLRALRPASVRTRAYGLWEVDAQWRMQALSVAHLFVQPAFYRARAPLHGWQRVWGYGVGWEQGGASWSVSLYYTLMQDISLSEGLLNMGVATRF